MLVIWGTDGPCNDSRSEATFLRGTGVATTPTDRARGGVKDTVGEKTYWSTTPPLDSFLDTPVVRCEDGEIIIYPKLSLVEIDGELLDADDVTELAGAFTAATRPGPPDATLGQGKYVAGTWHVHVEDRGTIAVNGSPYPPSEIRRYLRSLRYAARLMDN